VVNEFGSAQLLDGDLETSSYLGADAVLRANGIVLQHPAKRMILIRRRVPFP
jgi:hypothetical protein